MSDNQDSDSEVNFNLNNVQPDEENDGQGNGGGEYVRQRRADLGTVRRSSAHIKPDPYTGEEDWEQYISYFEDCAELCQWSNREKLLYLATSLKNQARVHYSSLTTEEKGSFRLLTFNLAQRFGSRRQQSRWISKLQSRARERNETIGAFGDDIRLLSQKAYVTLDREAQEMLALQQFYKNVSPEMRCRLMDRDCRSIREAVEIVERYEEVIGKADGNARPSHVRGVSSSGVSLGINNHVDQREHGEPVNDIGYIKSSLVKIEERLQKLESKQWPTGKPSSRACYRCGSTDHMIRDCPVKRQNEWRSPGSLGNAKPSHQ